MLTQILVAVSGGGLIYIFVKHRIKIVNAIKRAIDFINPLRYQRIEVISTLEHCKKIANELNNHCLNYKVLGFDCEWVTVGGSPRPISLLQLASPEGLCGIFRISHMPTIPKELRDILQNDEILKVGVVPQDDARRLAREYGLTVGSTLDLRHLATLANRKPQGLSKLSQDVINIELDKDWRLRCSDWEASVLTERQLKYAANDAHVGVEIFKKLMSEILPGKFFQRKTTAWLDIMKVCEPFLDTKFSSASGTLASKGQSMKNSSKNNNTRRKDFSRNMCTRSKRLYDNCLLEAPDGEILCTCDKKKADWYLSQKLGTLVADEPYTVRLNFEPAGRAVGEVGKYYTLAKENQCVVCGHQDAYIRKNVVPREYRRHFPVVMKSHTSHDVLLLCPDCHQTSNISDLLVRCKLAKLCDAPMTGEEGGVKFIEIPKLRQLRSAARALLNNSYKIPEKRQEDLRQQILNHFPPGTEITEELLKTAADIDIVEEVDNYCSHGQKVVKEYIENLGGLVELEKLWRRHFLDTMKPRFLPEFWSVNHNEHRLEIRVSEGRIEETDIAVSGIKVTMEYTENLIEKQETTTSTS